MIHMRTCANAQMHIISLRRSGRACRIVFMLGTQMDQLTTLLDQLETLLDQLGTLLDQFRTLVDQLETLLTSWGPY